MKILSEMLGEFHGKGLMNTFALRYCALLFLTVLWVASLYAYRHGNFVTGIFGDLTEQISVNYASGETNREIDNTEAAIRDVSEQLAGVIRVINRGTNLPEIYYEDRDRYVIDLRELKSHLADLKAFN